MHTIRCIALVTVTACTSPPSRDVTPRALRPQVILLGDSITVGYRYAFAQRYPGRVASIAAIGQRTTWMFASFAPNACSFRDGIVVMLGGVNDIASGVSTQRVAATIAATVQRAHDCHLRAVVLTVLPWRGYPSWTKTKQTRTDALNATIRRTYEHIDANALLGDAAGYLRHEYRGPSLPDGFLHPNTSGYDRIIAAIIARISSL